ncbi:hypothetical protein [Kineosporia sp. NBRC 101731]|uniref:hypothetical protein n=1 Tax=Kineosporia sp. NBRC 101731 TaxID=3032199 RepID=UPI0024A1924B|nr:hypothetical protein [Kineosporia sp. NBRC 101731]GLY32255.1 hypothetical protein Kisp02_56200 [Kineosporia sp. NBRC 101731]
MFRVKRSHRIAAAAAGTLAALGTTVAVGDSASAAVNTLQFCVQSGSGSINVKPHDFAPGIGSPVISSKCWSTYFDTQGWSQIDVYHNGSYAYSTSWNSNLGSKAIYL